MATSGDALPLDFIRQVFRSLPDATLAQAAQTCRSWSSLAHEEYAARWQRRWSCGGQQLLTNTPELSVSQAYGRRHKVDCAALRLLQDMQWPGRRANALRQFRSWGTDVLDVLLLASRCQGPGCLSLRYWASHVLAQVKAKLAAAELQQLPNTVPEAATSGHPLHLAVVQAALCIAAVHQPTVDMHTVLQVLDQLAAEAHRRLACAAVEKAARSSSGQRSTRSSAGHAEITCGRTGPCAVAVLGSGIGESQQASSSCALTTHEALEVINQLLFGPAKPEEEQQQQQQQQADGPATARTSAAASSTYFSMADPPPAPQTHIPTDEWGLGLQGNREDFYAPSNSLLPDVLATGKGIPITLAIIHMAVCQRVGLDVQLVNMPMRVINCLRAAPNTAPISLGSPHDLAPAGLAQPQLNAGQSQVDSAAGISSLGLQQPVPLGGLGWSAHVRPPSHSGSTASTVQLSSGQASCSLPSSIRSTESGITPVTVLPNEQDVYIDLFAEGKLMDDSDLKHFMGQLGIHLPTSRLQPLSPKGIAARMCANLCDIYHARREASALCLRMMLELATAVTPGARDMWAQRLHAALVVKDFDDAHTCVPAIQELTTQHMPSLEQLAAVTQQMRQLETYVEGLQREYSTICTTVKKRSGHPSVQLCIGQLIRHTQLGYRGVVYGWDPQCSANSDWMTQMDLGVQVEALPGGGARQPFYCVLVDERDRQLSRTYVAQCNLETLPGPGAHLPAADDDLPDILGRASAGLGAHSPALSDDLGAMSGRARPGVVSGPDMLPVAGAGSGAGSGSGSGAGAGAPAAGGMAGPGAGETSGSASNQTAGTATGAVQTAGDVYENSAAEGPAAVPVPDLPIKHADLGMYFTGYDASKGCFIPNASLRARFPEDGDIMGWDVCESMGMELQQYLLETMSSG